MPDGDQMLEAIRIMCQFGEDWALVVSRKRNFETKLSASSKHDQRREQHHNIPVMRNTEHCNLGTQTSLSLLVGFNHFVLLLPHLLPPASLSIQ